MQLDYYKTTLEKAGVTFESGLSQAEVQKIEQTCRFSFPPDLKEFLMFALPVSHGFVDWRRASMERIHEQLAWPYEGMCFDIKYNRFWLGEWGKRPTSSNKACEIAQEALQSAPVLIPIRGHRYIPDRPCEADNPVFSVHQTDIIYYGTNLANYFENEFAYYFGKQDYELRGPIKEIDFWSSLTS